MAEGNGAALRYRPDVSPFHAIEEVDRVGWEGLATLAGPGGVVVLFRDEVGPPAAGSRTLLAGGDGRQMVAAEDTAWSPAADARPLGDDDDLACSAEDPVDRDRELRAIWGPLRRKPLVPRAAFEIGTDPAGLEATRPAPADPNSAT